MLNFYQWNKTFRNNDLPKTIDPKQNKNNININNIQVHGNRVKCFKHLKLKKNIKVSTIIDSSNLHTIDHSICKLEQSLFRNVAIKQRLKSQDTEKSQEMVKKWRQSSYSRQYEASIQRYLSKKIKADNNNIINTNRLSLETKSEVKNIKLVFKQNLGRYYTLHEREKNNSYTKYKTQTQREKINSILFQQQLTICQGRSLLDEILKKQRRQQENYLRISSLERTHNCISKEQNQSILKPKNMMKVGQSLRRFKSEMNHHQTQTRQAKMSRYESLVINAEKQCQQPSIIPWSMQMKQQKQ